MALTTSHADCHTERIRVMKCRQSAVCTETDTVVQTIGVRWWDDLIAYYERIEVHIDMYRTAPWHHVLVKLS